MNVIADKVASNLLFLKRFAAKALSPTTILEKGYIFRENLRKKLCNRIAEAKNGAILARNIRRELVAPFL